MMERTNRPRERKTWWMTTEVLPAPPPPPTTECRRINIKGHLYSDCTLYIDPLNLLCINKFVSSGISDLTMALADNRKLQIENEVVNRMERETCRKCRNYTYVIWSTKSTTTTQNIYWFRFWRSDKKSMSESRWIFCTQNCNEKKN